MASGLPVRSGSGRKGLEDGGYGRGTHLGLGLCQRVTHECLIRLVKCSGIDGTMGQHILATSIPGALRRFFFSFPFRIPSRVLSFYALRFSSFSL